MSILEKCQTDNGLVSTRLFIAVLALIFAATTAAVMTGTMTMQPTHAAPGATAANKAPVSRGKSASLAVQKEIFDLIATAKYAEADAKVKAALTNYPNDPRLILARGRIASYNCDFKSAVKDFTIALNANAKDPDTLAARADALVQLEDYDHARVDYGDAIILTRIDMYRSELSRIDDLEYDAAHKEKDPAKRWALACSALLFTENELGCKSLMGGLPERVSETGTLRKWWGVTDRDSLLAILQHQVKQGHNAKWQQMRRESQQGNLVSASAKFWEGQSDTETQISMVKKYGTIFGDRGLAAWDLSRYICLCRWGYQCGYITEAEAWKLMMPVAAKIQATCKGWNYLGTEYLLGRKFWSNSQYMKSEKSYAFLKHRLLHSPDSPWVQLAWNTPLNCKGDDATILRAIAEVAAARR